MKHDAIYLRYSSELQTSGTSIAYQREACMRLARQPVREYADEARTGRAVGGREALRRLLDDAALGEIARMIVYKFDRIGRAAETHVIVRDLEEMGVEVISATEGHDALSRGVHLVMAEHTIRELSQRTRDGLESRFHGGYWTGGKAPLGYRLVRDDDAGTSRRSRLVIDDAEAAKVRTIFEGYVEKGLGLKSLGRWLEDRGVWPREAKRWSHVTLRCVLTNRMYIGEVKYRVTRKRIDRATGRKIQRANAEAEHLTRQDESLRIVDDQTFEAAARAMKFRAKSVRRKREPRPFGGLLTCGCCRRPFYAMRSRAKGREYRYYVCGTRSRLGPRGCPNRQRLDEDGIMERITRTITMLTEATGLIDEVTAEALELLQDERACLDDLREQSRQLARQKDHLVGLIADPDLAPGAKRAIAERLADVQAKHEQAQASIEEAAESTAVTAEQLAKDVQEVIASLRERLGRAEPAEIASLLQQTIGRIEVAEDGTLRRAEQMRVTPRAGLEPAT